MKKDPGQAAIKGFYMQCLVVILEGMNSDEWSEFTIEPEDQSSNTNDGPDSMLKVDVHWFRKDGTKIWDQVKYRSKAISKGDIIKWAKEMSIKCKPSPSTTLRLQLVGVIGCDLPNKPHGVIVMPQGTQPNAEGNAVRQLTRFLERKPLNQRPTDQQTGKLCANLCGILLEAAKDGTKWTKSRLLETVDRQLIAITTNLQEELPPGLHLRQLVLLRDEETGRTCRYVVLQAHNPHQSSLFLRVLSLSITETEGLTVHYATDGQSSLQPGYGGGFWVEKPELNKVDIHIRIDRILSPNQTITGGLYFSEQCILQEDEGRGTFSDPIMRVHEHAPKCSVTSCYVFPVPAKISPYRPCEFRSHLILELPREEITSSIRKFSPSYKRKSPCPPDLAKHERTLCNALIARMHLMIYGLEMDPVFPQDLTMLDAHISVLKTAVKGSITTSKSRG